MEGSGNMCKVKAMKNWRWGTALDSSLWAKDACAESPPLAAIRNEGPDTQGVGSNTNCITVTIASYWEEMRIIKTSEMRATTNQSLEQ